MKFNPLTKALVFVAGLAAVAATSSGGTATSGKAIKQVTPPVEEESWWHASLSAGYDSLYMFRGIDVLDGDSLVTVDLNFTAYNFTLGAWYGFDAGSGDYNELDLYASYAWSLGPVAISGGVIGYLYPDDDGADTLEVFASLTTDKIEWITPTFSAYWDVDAIEGGYLEFKLSRSFEIVENISFDPYALVSYDLEYNSSDTDWNNVQVGASLPIKMSENIAISPYIAYSWALSAIDERQEDELWGGAKITFSF